MELSSDRVFGLRLNQYSTSSGIPSLLSATELALPLVTQTVSLVDFYAKFESENYINVERKA